MNRWLFLGLVLLFAGCATAPGPFTAQSSQQALVRWNKPDQSLVCEAVFSRSADSSVRAQLYKGSPKVLLTLSLTAGKNFTASGPLAGFGWRGDASAAPLGLSTWSRLMQDYQSSPSWPDGENEIHSGDARTAVIIAQRQIRSLSVSNNLNGENITAKFRAP